MSDGVAKIGIKELKDITNLNEKYVREKLAELVDARFIRVESHGRRNVGVSRYRLLTIPRDEEVGSVPLPSTPEGDAGAQDG